MQLPVLTAFGVSLVGVKLPHSARRTLGAVGCCVSLNLGTIGGTVFGVPFVWGQAAHHELLGRRGQRRSLRLMARALWVGVAQEGGPPGPQGARTRSRRALVARLRVARGQPLRLCRASLA